MSKSKAFFLSVPSVLKDEFKTVAKHYHKDPFDII